MTIESKLIHKPLVDMGRAANMAWVTIGGETEIASIRSNRILKRTEFAIHLQCPWRIEDIQQRMIILASNDVYHPKDGCEWTENFNWDIQGNNLFDQKCKCFIEENKPLTISEIHFTDYNDLSVLLSDRFLLSTFIDNSFGGESWRILDNVNRKHFVCTEGHVEVL